MEMLSHPLPYTTLLPDVLERLSEATLLLPDARKRSIKRIGIVSNTRAAEDEMPPGIRRFINYVSKPWSALDSYSFQIASELDKNDNWTDRCIHTISRPEDKHELPSLAFDWQRTFTDEQKINSDSVREIIGHAQRAALVYFEELAEGNRLSGIDTNSAG